MPEHSMCSVPAVFVPALRMVFATVSSPKDIFSTLSSVNTMTSPDAPTWDGVILLQAMADEVQVLKRTVCSPPVAEVIVPNATSVLQAILVPDLVSSNVSPLVAVNCPLTSTVLFDCLTNSPLDADAVAEASALTANAANTARTISLRRTITNNLQISEHRRSAL